MIASTVIAAALATSTLTPVRVTVAPSLDGAVDDPAWKDAAASSEFTQKSPFEGRQPIDSTAVRVVYDDDAIYFAIDCSQSTPVVRGLTRRDNQVESDYVAIDLDTRSDGRTAYHFQVSAAGVLVDGIRFDDTELSLEWDENWEATTSVHDRGWTAEIRIPLRILRFEPSGDQIWGAQIRRYVSSRQELDEWTYIPRGTAGEVSQYGRMGPFEQLNAGTGFELRPFVLGRVRLDAVQSSAASALGGSVGLDAKWHLGDDLTLDLSVLPDFGQVEADQLVLNLSSFETLFPEKRAFFLEGAELFSTPLQVLYTRRIGRAAPSPSVAAGEQLTGTSTPSPIYGAAKLIARAGPLEVGALSAVTGPASVPVQVDDGTEHSRLADPYTMYNALRIRAPLGRAGRVGLIAGSTMRFESAADYPDELDPATGATGALCPSGTIRVQPADCFHDAHVGGVDALWRSGDFVLSGQAVGSIVRGGPARQLTDGTLVEPGDAGAGGVVRAAKEGGNWIGELSYEMESRKLDLNDLGFLSQQNLHHVWFAAAHRITSPWRYFLEHRAQIEIFQRRNWDGLMLPSGYQINSSGRLRNFWSYFAELHYRPAYFDDREIGNGVALERSGVWGLELEAETDPRYPVAGVVATTTQHLADVSVFEGFVALRFRLVPELDLRLEQGLGYRSGEPRFVEQIGTDEYLFGRLRARSLTTTVRSTYTFTPGLTFQLFTQLFVADLEYSEFSTYLGSSRRIRDSDRVDAMPPAVLPDSSDTAVNATAVLRWEYNLGSTLFLVYSRASDADVVLAKLSYWWGGARD